MSIDHIQLDFFKHKPPGIIRGILDFILAQAPHPVYEIALTGALGLFAGIVGRQYNFSSDGLNQYLMLVAGTGRGKEAIGRGIDRIVDELTKRVNYAHNILGPAEMASGQSLITYLTDRKEKPCFVSVFGEIGYKLHQINNPRATSAEQMLKRVLLDLYNKSGEGRTLHPSVYADRIKNTDEVKSPALTIVGESTGEMFYSALDERHISIGLIPRFTIVDYDGPIVDFNEAHAHATIPDDLLEKLAELLVHCHKMTVDESVQKVAINSDAKQLLRDIREHSRQVINSSGGGVIDELWNRAAQKAGRLAALLAVSHNYVTPTIDRDMVLWAGSLIISDIVRLMTKFGAGEIGLIDDADNTKQIDEIRKVMRKYFSREPTLIDNRIRRIMLEENVIPYSDIHRSVAKIAAFKNDKRKATAAIKSTLSTLCDMGIIQDIRFITDKNDIDRIIPSNGKCYKLISESWILGIDRDNDAYNPRTFWNE